MEENQYEGVWFRLVTGHLLKVQSTVTSILSAYQQFHLFPREQRQQVAW